MAGPIITLTTDFGTFDPYVGVMKGVTLGINPQATIVDITHDVCPQGVEQAAFLIAKSHSYFPRGTIHLVVVDPGVGTTRRAILLTTLDQAFIAPDNGVLSRIPGIEKGRLATGYRAYSLTKAAFWRWPLGNTFHGRDVFAPVAAHLSTGIAPDQIGEEIETLTHLPIEVPAWKSGVLQGRVVYVDRFGNLVTDIEAELLADRVKLRFDVKDVAINGLSRSYAEGADLLAIIGSFDTLEIAARNGNAQDRLGADVGEVVQVSGA